MPFSTPCGRCGLSLSGVKRKRRTLELGGKSPNIVLDDCDIEAAAAATRARLDALAHESSNGFHAADQRARKCSASGRMNC